MQSWVSVEGSPQPLGVSWVPEESAYNFALTSKHATAVTLLLYTTEDLFNPVVSYAFDPIRNRTGFIWHCRIGELQMKGATLYAYSVSGPDQRNRYEWHAFDPRKILLDPYATSIYFPGTFSRKAAAEFGSNAGQALLGAILKHEGEFDWGEDHRPRHEHDMVIYELHVRGFTQNPNSGVSEFRRGTYAGLIEKIPYLKELGVTAVELMPVFQYGPQEHNYWGYMPLSFFALHQGYSSECYPAEQRREFRHMVKALHEADIEVILDVVYNHTAEEDEFGPTYNFKGIDNATYYIPSGDPAHPYANFSGCGNSLKISDPIVRLMIADSLRFWVDEMHIDGFRFDLASVGVRNPDGSIGVNPPLAGMAQALPQLARARNIVEPWDVGMGGYLLGRGFPGKEAWQWNGQFRDEIRHFVRGDPGLIGTLMSRLYGSDDLFPDTGEVVYHPYQSVNYISAHDGMTTYDLTAYNNKRNWANGQNNADGEPDSFSWNCGWEGDEGAPDEVIALRKRQVRNFACLLFLANGTPMLRMGDEGMHTQGGNNNPYNQDNTTTWMDWDRLRANHDIFRFFKLIIAFRKSHPSIARGRFWREDVKWYGVERAVDLGWESRQLAYCLHGASQQDDDLYVMINSHWEPHVFVIQEPGSWLRAIDTSRESPDDIRDPGTEIPVTLQTYDVGPRSIVVLVRRVAPRAQVGV
jgi:glycogen operon protein